MRIRSVLLAGTCVFGGLVFQTAIGAQAPASVLAGVYTAEQATRGKAIYTENCAMCHGDKLDGQEASFPVLAGNEFVGHWQNVGEVFDKINLSMPATSPGSLKPAEVADVVAYILSVNKYPAGTSELVADAEPLSKIKLEPAPQ